MEIDKAKEIVSLLAYGIDPTTGEVLPNDSPYNHPSVIRALFSVLGSVGVPKKQIKQSMEEKQTQNVASGRPRNAGLPWTEELRDKIAIMFKNGTSIDELAEYFERTSGAILSQLMHQGLIDEESAQKGMTTQSRTANAAHDAARSSGPEHTNLDRARQFAQQMYGKQNDDFERQYIDEGIAGTRDDNMRARARLGEEIGSRGRD